MQTALEDVAGTGLPRWQAYRTQTLAFHEQWQDFFIARQIRQQKLTAAEVATVPVFAFREEPTADVTGRMVTALAWLLVPAAVLWGIGLMRLKKYAVV
jgi:ABC-2 type transport system permease protein